MHVNNLATFSRLIRTQLLKRNRVSLPGLGSFIAEDQPATFSDEGRLMIAPTRTVTFSVKETWNDEVIEQVYAAELEGAMLELDDDETTRESPPGMDGGASKLFLEQAKRDVALFVSAVESQLRNSGAFNFPGLGTMTIEGKRGEITFLQSADCDLAPDGFGLTPVSVKPLSSPSRIYEPEPQVKKQITKTTPKPRIKIKKSKKRVPKWLIITLGTLIFIIVALLLVYIFRAELRPLLMKLLYTPAQLEQIMGR